MNNYNTENKYESFKIPDRRQVQEDGTSWSSPQVKADTTASQDDGVFYVIDYDSSDMKGVGKFVMKSQKIAPPEKDEIRDLFHSMRDIARANHSQYYNSSKFYDARVQQENAKIFYKQGMFMKDFTDSYPDKTPFSSYFPNYQVMNYEQLRTYFTWRTEVRKGNVTDISLSYAFLYIYELLGNIGIDNPQDGLNKLMSFWKQFSVYNKTIERYILRWLKDYHIYYALPQSFKDFVEENNLSMHYPKLADTDNKFDLFCAVSKYDIRSSAFYADDKIKLITDCFYFLTSKLEQVFMANGIPFDEAIFQPTKKMAVWHPFKDALFYPWIKQPDRRIVLSENEIYFCKQNNWSSSSVLTSESGRLLIGYIMKQMESVLRTATKYKYKLSANINSDTHAVVGKLHAAGLPLEKIISDAVMEFYREATKTVVVVDHNALSKIRQEALAIQEKLIVPEQSESYIPIQTALNIFVPTPQDMSSMPKPVDMSAHKLIDDPVDKLVGALADELVYMTADKLDDELVDIPTDMQVDGPADMMVDVPADMMVDVPANMLVDVSADKLVDEPTDKLVSALVDESFENLTSLSGPWGSLKNSLSETELQALSILLSGVQDIKKFSDNNGVMLEVLIDGINEKTMDYVGDNLLDEEFTIYDDYKDQVKEMVR